MNTIFREEWNLYLKAGARPAFCGVELKATNASFDAPVKVGEVRVFADMNRPFVGARSGGQGPARRTDRPGLAVHGAGLGA